MRTAIAVLFMSLTAAAQTTTKVDWTQLKSVPPLVTISAGSGAPTGACTTPTEAYVDTVSRHLYWCVSENVWADVGAAAGLSPTATWAAMEAGTAGAGSITASMTWAQVEVL